MVLGWRAVCADLAASSSTSPGSALRQAAESFASVGGTAGPLWGTALLRAGRALGDAPEIDPAGAARAAAAAVEGMVERGRCDEGMKTVVDAMAPGGESARRRGPPRSPAPRRARGRRASRCGRRRRRGSAHPATRPGRPRARTLARARRPRRRRLRGLLGRRSRLRVDRSGLDRPVYLAEPGPAPAESTPTHHKAFARSSSMSAITSASRCYRSPITPWGRRGSPTARLPDRPSGARTAGLRSRSERAGHDECPRRDDGAAPLDRRAAAPLPRRRGATRTAPVPFAFRAGASCDRTSAPTNR